MATSYKGTEGQSGLSARYAARGESAPTDITDGDQPGEWGHLPAPQVSEDLGSGSHGTVDVDVPDDDFQARIAAFMSRQSGLPSEHSALPSATSTGADDETPADGGAAGDAHDGAPADPAELDPSGGGAQGIPPPAPPSPEPPQTVIIEGQEFTLEELRHAIGTAATVARWSPEFVSDVNDLAFGRAQVVRGQPAGAPTPAAPASPPAAPQYVADPDDYMDATAAQVDAQLAAQLGQVNQSVEQQQQQLRQLQYAEAERAQARELERVNKATEQVRSRFDFLADEHIDQLQGDAVPFVQAAIQQMTAQGRPLPTDLTHVYDWAMERAIYTNPALLQTLIDRQVSAKVDEQLSNDQLAAARSRRDKAASLAGSPQGSVPRTAPPARDTRSLTEAETRAAMAAELRSVMNQ